MSEKKSFNAVMACDTGTFTLTGGSAALLSALVANATVLKPVGLTVASPVLGQPDLVVHSSTDAQAPNPPPIPDFLFRLFAKSKRDQAAVGDINELYERDCVNFGRARAGRLYWAGTLRFLWPLLVRTISRAMKLAVIIDALKRYFLG